MKPHRVISISLYVEELIALDAKVEALKAAGYRRASRSSVLALAAVHIDDEQLVALLPKSRTKVAAPEPVAKPARRAWDGYKCGACGLFGHNKKTCKGLEVESRVEAIR